MRIAVVLIAALALPVGSAMLAAPGQQAPVSTGSVRPGESTKGVISIENRGPNEAIPITAHEPLPVVIQNVATGTPMAVRLSGPTAGSAPPPVAVQEAVQQWEYLTVAVPADATAQSLTTVFAAQGNAGWTPAGVQVTGRGGTLVLLKRPRS
jgi:hypothetical protein